MASADAAVEVLHGILQDVDLDTASVALALSSKPGALADKSVPLLGRHAGEAAKRGVTVRELRAAVSFVAECLTRAVLITAGRQRRPSGPPGDGGGSSSVGARPTQPAPAGPSPSSLLSDASAFPSLSSASSSGKGRRRLMPTPVSATDSTVGSAITEDFGSPALTGGPWSAEMKPLGPAGSRQAGGVPAWPARLAAGGRESAWSRVDSSTSRLSDEKPPLPTHSRPPQLLASCDNPQPGQAKGAQSGRLDPPERPAEGAVGAEADASVQPLSECGSRLVELHAGLLSNGAVPDLSLELGQLLQLLAMGPYATPSSTAGDDGRNPCKAAGLEVLLMVAPGAGYQYAIAVLRASGGIFRASPPRALAALIDTSSEQGRQLEALAPDLFAIGSDCIAEDTKRRQRNDKAFNSVQRQRDATSSLVGLTWTLGQQGGQDLPRSHPNQRLLSNLERCRDEFVRLMQDAAKVPFAPASSPREGNKVLAAKMISSSDETLSMMQDMRQSAGDLMDALHGDNVMGFADIFLGGYLQAARTGEAVLDDKLASLEQKDPSKFQRLNQRLHGRSSKQREKSMAPRGSNGHQQYQRGPGPPKKRTQHDDRDMSSAHLVMEFPASLRLYVTFLESCDSARLNGCLNHKAAAKLLETSQGGILVEGARRGWHQEEGKPGRLQCSLGEQTVQLSALALLLSYLNFASAASSQSPAPSAHVALPYIGEAQSLPGPIQVGSVLDAAMKSGAFGLGLCVPWVLSYIQFLPSSPLAMQAAMYSGLFDRLQRLHSSPRLCPSHPDFGLAALCIRSLLDGLWALEWVQRLPQPEQGPEAAPSADLAVDAILSEVISDLTASLDSRYVSYCCQSLEDAVQSMMDVCFGGRPKGGPSERRRLTPSSPKTQLAAASPRIPDDILAKAHPQRNPMDVQLQKAFFDSYSGPGFKVSLRELVTYVTDVVSANSLSETLSATLPGLLSDLDSQIQQLSYNYPATVPEAEGTARESTVQSSPEWMASVAAATTEALHTILRLLHQDAIERVTSSASQALRVLVPASLGQAVWSTASRICIDYASVACAQQLIELIPQRVEERSRAAAAKAAASRPQAHVAHEDEAPGNVGVLATAIPDGVEERPQLKQPRVTVVALHRRTEQRASLR